MGYAHHYLDSDVMAEAINLALNFKRHCQEHNISPHELIAGVSHDAYVVRTAALKEGRDFIIHSLLDQMQKLVKETA